METIKKAKELIEKYSEIFYPHFTRLPIDHIENYVILCVDEIIEVLAMEKSENILFWCEVKRIIEDREY